MTSHLVYDVVLKLLHILTANDRATEWCLQDVFNETIYFNGMPFGGHICTFIIDACDVRKTSYELCWLLKNVTVYW